MDEVNVLPLIFHSWSVSEKEVNEILLCNFVVSLHYQIAGVLTPHMLQECVVSMNKEK